MSVDARILSLKPSLTLVGCWKSSAGIPAKPLSLHIWYVWMVGYDMTQIFASGARKLPLIHR